MYREIGDDWDIGYLQGKWDSDGFPISGYSTEDIVIIGDVHDDDLEGTDDYHPDIAIDPATGFFTDADDAETGDIHIVWTGYCGAENHPYRLNYIRYNGDDDEWDDPVMIYEDDMDYAAWAPRIAIGNAGGGLGEIVGIVYSSYSSNPSAYAPEIWHVGGAYWDVDSEYPDNASFIHFSMDDTNDAGFPRLDLAPRHSDAGDACGSIVFEQSAGGDPPLFRPLEINNVRNDYWSIADPGYGGFFGAVSIHYPDGDPEATLSYFDQFMANRWRPRVGRFLLEDDPPQPTWVQINNPLVQGDLTYDDFIDFLTIETFQGGDIVTIDAGTWDNAYWLGFCDKIDAGAVYVNVAFGDSVP